MKLNGTVLVLLFIVSPSVWCVPTTTSLPNVETTGTSSTHAAAGAVGTTSTHDGHHSAAEAAGTSAHDGHHSAAEGTSAHDGHHAGDEEHHEHHSYHVAKVDFNYVEIPIVISLWLFCASLAKIAFHMTPRLGHIFPESCLLIVIGVIIGLIIFHTTTTRASTLTPGTFFLYMLPPIIFDAGYFMPNRLFFDHLGTILLFAVLATIFNTLTIGFSLWAVGITGVYGMEMPLLHALLFAALISAVDPVAVLAVFEEIHVDEVLYIIVFGESLLNDAVTVVLYHMFEAYAEMGEGNISPGDVFAGIASFFVVALGGTGIGIIWGFLTGFVTRFTNHVRVIEPFFVFVMAYLSYLNAELFHFSGILAITFCGITMKNYVEANISAKSHTTVKYAMKMISSSSETIIFMFLGVVTVHDEHHWNTAFIILTQVFCAVYRTIGVFLFSIVANRFRLQQLGRVEKFVMSYGGLRGAVAFALVLLIDSRVIPQQPMFVTATITTVFFTVFVQGMTIKPLVEFLKVKKSEKRKATMNERIHERCMDHITAGMECILGHHGNRHLRDKFRKFDRQYIRPCLIRDAYRGADPKIMETFSKLAYKDALEAMQREPSMLTPEEMHIEAEKSVAALLRSFANNPDDPSNPSHRPSVGYAGGVGGGWNLDMHELEYNPSKKDMTDAKIHHLLEEELHKPNKKNRRLSYSRHAVHDKDLITEPQVNYRTQMNIRRRISENVIRAQSKGNKEKAGMLKKHYAYLNAALNASDENFDLYDDDDSNHLYPPGDYRRRTSSFADNVSRRFSDMSYRWRRGTDATFVLPGGTAQESQLPWRRNDDVDGSQFAVQQNEFPPWCSNKDYLAYSSPTNTFLGDPRAAPPSVIGMFKRDSVSSGLAVPGSKRSSLTPGSQSHDTRRSSAHDANSDVEMGHASRKFSVFVTAPIPEATEEREREAETADEGSESSTNTTKL